MDIPSGLSAAIPSTPNEMGTRSLFSLKRRRIFHKLSARIALISALATAFCALILSPLFLAFPVGFSIVIVLISAVATYLITFLLLADRIDLARTTLKEIRKHQFENLETTQQPDGDELNALIGQVHRTGLTLGEEIQELKKIENYRKEFLENVSHELKTPIFAIQGFAETLLDGALEDERVSRKFIEKILRNALRLSNLARDLTEISKIETGELKMHIEPFKVGRLIQEVTESLELTAQNKNITLSHHVPDGLPAVLGDRERLRQVLTNLIDNGIKYNSPGGKVETMAQLLPSGEVSLSVTDNGIGLAPHDIYRVTERFYRVDKSRSRDEGGTGLGLSIVKHILAAHDRKLSIHSSLGSGSTFSFTLPRAEASMVRLPRVNAEAGPPLEIKSS